MGYKLKFTKLSYKEWNMLDSSVKTQFQKKLKERLVNPKILKDKLSGFENIYKIKLKTKGFRLAYEVKEAEIIVLVLAVGKRENSGVYNNLSNRI